MLKKSLLLSILLCSVIGHAQQLPLLVQVADTSIPAIGTGMIRTTNVYGGHLYFDSSLVTRNSIPESVYYNSFDNNGRVIHQRQLATKTRKQSGLFSYQYDSSGRRVHMLTEIFNQYSSVPENKIVNYEYDNAGKLLAKKEFYSPQDNRDSAVTTFVYDKAGRIITERRKEYLKQNINYGYAQAELLSSYEYNSVGNLTAIRSQKNNSKDTKWQKLSAYVPAYDKAGRLISDTLWNYNEGADQPEWGGANLYSYDADGRMLDSITLTKEVVDDKATIRRQMKTGYEYSKQGLPQTKTIYYDSAGHFAVMQQIFYQYKDISLPARNNTFKMPQKIVRNMLPVAVKWKEPQEFYIAVYDMQGQVVLYRPEGETADFSKNIQLEDLQPGVYNILLIGAKETANGQFTIR